MNFYIKWFLVVMVSTFAGLAMVETHADRYIDPTIPGTNSRDYYESGIGIDDDGNAYRTIPGTHSRDYYEPGYGYDGDGSYYQTIPGTNSRDYYAPGYIVEDY